MLDVEKWLESRFSGTSACALLWLLRLLCILGVAVLFLYAGSVQMHAKLARFSVSFFSSLGTLCLLWALFKRYSLIFWIPFMVFEGIQLLAYYQYSTFINHPLVLAEILEGSRNEILTYVTVGNVAIVCAILFCSVALSYLLSRCMRSASRRWLFVLAAISFLIVGLKFMGPSNKKRCISSMWPMSEFYTLGVNIRQACSFNEFLCSYLRSLPSPAERPSSCSTLTSDAGVIVVLHVGESIRADRLGFNGYRNKGRSTTPWLDSQKGKSLINYTDCISSSLFTVYAYTPIMTDARRAFPFSMENESQGSFEEILAQNDPLCMAQAGSIIDLFAANSFSVHSFLGKLVEQDLKFEKVVRILSEKSQEKHHSPDKPLGVLPQMKSVVSSSPHENMFFFICNEGNHAPFHYYEDSYAPFQPARADLSNPSAHAEEISNAYDNCTYYTDEYVRRVAEILKGRPFVYVYVSDHGEYLGHDGFWGRGGVAEKYYSTSGCRVGMFIITSPEFEALHPHFAEAVKNLRAHADMTVGHEHIYHTLLGVIGIETPYYVESLDLSSKSPEPYTGPQPEKK